MTSEIMGETPCNVSNHISFPTNRKAKIALVTEKPYAARLVISSLMRVFSDLTADCFKVGWANEFYHLNTSFVYPRGAKYAAYPITLKPAYREMAFDPCYVDNKSHLRIADGSRIMSQRVVPDQEQGDAAIEARDDFDRYLMDADAIYLALSTCPSKSHVRLRVLERLKSAGIDTPVVHVSLNSLVEEHLDRSVAAPLDLNEIETYAHSSKIKRYFDYNYLLNAQVIMKLASIRAFGEKDRLEWPLTKNELQVLFYLHRSAPVKDGPLIARLDAWMGTGRYYFRRPDYSGLGSPASRWMIIENLIKQGLIQRSKIGALSVSDKGKRFIAHLHPDCEDPDQVLRLHVWTQLPIDEAYNKIDRYIKTFFGKQKRYLSKITTNGEDNNAERNA